MTESVYNVEEVAGKGMGCVATKDIKKGSLVLREKPALFIEKQDPKSCFKSFSMMISENQETYLALYNAYDCDSAEWSSTMRVSHKDACNWISGLGANDLSGLSQEMALTVWQICLTNSFDNGVCLNTSRFNHSCNANGHNFWETKTETRELRAWRDIKQGEEITLTYKVFWMETREERRTILKEGFNFHCECEACEITEEEVQREAKSCELFKEEEMRMKELKRFSTRECNLQEAKCLKQMWRLAREMKAINRKYFLWEIVEELFDVSCQAYMSTTMSMSMSPTIKDGEKARLIKDINVFASTGLKMAKKLFGVDGVPVHEGKPNKQEAVMWRARKEDPVKYFLKEYEGACEFI